MRFPAELCDAKCLTGDAKWYAQNLGTIRSIAFSPWKSHKNIFSIWHGRCIILGTRKRELEMSKTIENAVKRIKQEQRIAKAYDMPTVNKDMQKNDEDVRKFYESMKGWKWKLGLCLIVEWKLSEPFVPKGIRKRSCWRWVGFGMWNTFKSASPP